MPEQSEGILILPDLVRDHARNLPDQTAVIDGDIRLTYSALDKEVDHVAAALQQAGHKVGESIAVCGVNSAAYVVLFLGCLRAGMVPALIAPSSTPKSISEMACNSEATLLFIDDNLSESVAPHLDNNVTVVSLEQAAFEAWYAPSPNRPAPVTIDPELSFNIIYSSGTTGTPKGIVHSHGMRHSQIERLEAFGYGPDAVVMIATPLYSNTTLVSFIPAIAFGGTIVIAGKFDASKYLTLASKYRATHGMLVPVQYKRIMAVPDFDDYDLDSFMMKFCTSAPFAADLKADIVKRWPGGLVEFYGMTEGGVSFMLLAHEYTDKLHTVGKPSEGCDVRMIDEEGNEIAAGEIGEVVGRSGAMMKGYYGEPEKTRETEWFDSDGNLYIRTGDVGRLDEEGFLTLMDRKKDMIISGGFNIYPSDLEAELITHDAIADVAVIGVPSEDWGETPVAVVVRAKGAQISGDEIKSWLAERVGKTQRISDVVFRSDMPRSAIGKVLKRELRDAYIAT